MFTKEQLIEQIREMGVVSTDTVVIHTSMRAIGDVDGGADTVIEQLACKKTHKSAYQNGGKINESAG